MPCCNVPPWSLKKSAGRVDFWKASAPGTSYSKLLAQQKMTHNISQLIAAMITIFYHLESGAWKTMENLSISHIFTYPYLSIRPGGVILVGRVDPKLREPWRPKLPGSRITARTNSDLSTLAARSYCGWGIGSKMFQGNQEPLIDGNFFKIYSESTSWGLPTRVVPSNMARVWLTCFDSMSLVPRDAMTKNPKNKRCKARRKLCGQEKVGEPGFHPDSNYEYHTFLVKKLKLEGMTLKNFDLMHCIPTISYERWKEYERMLKHRLWHSILYPNKPYLQDASPWVVLTSPSALSCPDKARPVFVHLHQHRIDSILPTHENSPVGRSTKVSFN